MRVEATRSPTGRPPRQRSEPLRSGPCPGALRYIGQSSDHLLSLFAEAGLRPVKVIVSLP